MNDHQQSTAQVPLRFVIEGASHAGDGTLCCPVCGGDYVHIGPVIIEQGQTQTRIERDSTFVGGTDRGEHYRGSSVQIRFYGECGHLFWYDFAFYKGNVSASLGHREITPDEPWLTLWRD